jgi:Uma2 family endonuclease
MRAVVLEVDERTIAERHRLGQDKRDEMWKGVLHMVPRASHRHQSIATELLLSLAPAAHRHGLRVHFEEGVFASENDYRVPDLVVFEPSAIADRGIDGAPRLVIEIRSPGDESYEKLPWYLARGAGAVLIIDRDSLALDLYTATGKDESEADGSVWLEALDIRISPEGDTLRADDRLLDI